MAPTNECKCGCGQQTGGPKSKFRQGHDQKLVSNLAEDIVNGKPPTGMGALSQAKAKRPVEERIELVAEILTTRVSEAISNKFVNAANRKVDANKRKADRPAPKAKDAKKAPAKPRAKKPAQSAAEVAETEAIKAHATPDEVEQAKADAESAEATTLMVGAPIKIRVRGRVIDAEVAGMSQAGKVTVATYKGAKNAERRVENPTVVA